MEEKNTKHSNSGKHSWNSKGKYYNLKEKSLAHIRAKRAGHLFGKENQIEGEGRGETERSPYGDFS